ncbi:HD domain-containing protein [Algiphilus sp. W345]|uniref:HD domain-containing protein n=1 Tax=Banduia mediterranea TaxID=3075609 RepID=A0ABU2WGN6_9GAMM|nr:HD domain-containing protein [Algiphilus sp. W345]MDT0496799.1 HD domain-containing protein [Algiphilus sp. W345]
MTARRNDHDVTNTVCVADPKSVCAAVCGILARRYADIDLAPVRRGFDTFSRLFTGRLAGYAGCDTWYHDAQHSLDCALALARLVDGHERSEPASRRLGARRAVLGVLVALFHDAGYIRRSGDEAINGAEFTFTHVGRSGDFLARFLPQVGFAKEAALARRLAHFTGYEIALNQIAVRNRRDRMLGFMLGTADVMAQVSDRCYLEKCRDYLYREFTWCGLAGQHAAAPQYESADELLRKTPEFHRHLRADRLDGHFEGVYRYAAAHFQTVPSQPDPYSSAMDAQLRRLRDAMDAGDLGRLRRRPRVEGAQALRRRLGWTAVRTAAGASPAAPRLRPEPGIPAGFQPG